MAITRPLPPYDVVDIESAWIPEYEDLESTLAFELDPTYELYINGTLDPRGSTTAITLNNVRPTDSGMFVINVRDWNIEPNSVILAKADITE
ncbi:hypothetical protein [Methanogenium cariaci]|uniref:hypothetical protein n=1 Tax=Methanogenium cariaci TaxID=2197 RepID=UPI00155DAD61|nr:hypothetical protein [Methanogenium cariaci]